MVPSDIIGKFGEDTAAKRIDLASGKCRLGELLDDYGIPGQVESAYQGYGVVRYLMAPGKKFYFRNLEGIRSELELGMGMGGCTIGSDGSKVVIDFSMARSDRGSVGSRGIVLGDHPGELGFGMGMDVLGGKVSMDLAKAPHLLVAGTTGSGKSVFLNSMICGLAMSHSSDMLRFLLVDPKGGVEFGVYDDLPHMLHRVVTDVDTAIDGLNWCVGEMERRYSMLNELKVRSISEYNARLLTGDCAYHTLMPYIVVVIDEFADLMSTRSADLEGCVKRLAAKSRAVGIHLVLATQTPRKEVVTGELKANLPTRVCFRVSDQTDSRVMLDHNGAERLGGRGDMIYRSSEGEERRIQGCYLTDAEREVAVGYPDEPYGIDWAMDDWSSNWRPNWVSPAVAEAIIAKHGLDSAEEYGIPPCLRKTPGK